MGKASRLAKKRREERRHFDEKQAEAAWGDPNGVGGLARQTHTGVVERPETLVFDPWDVRNREARSLDRLLLGCGASPKPECVNFDLNAGARVDIVGDLTHTPWEWAEGDVIEDGHFSHVEASHVLEHIPHDVFEETPEGYLRRRTRLDGMTVLMNEVWRVLAPGGSFLSTVPSIASERAYGDPTHRRYMCMRSFAHYARHPQQDILKWKAWTGYDEGFEGCFVMDPSSSKDPDNHDLTVLMVKPRE